MTKALATNTSRTGVVGGKGSPIEDDKNAKVSTGESIFNEPATNELAKLIKKETGMTIKQFNAKYAPEGAETKVVNGVLHAAAGFQTPSQIKAEVADKARINALDPVKIEKAYTPPIVAQTPSQLATEAAKGAPPVTPESINQAKMANVGLKPTSVTQAEEASRATKIAGVANNNFRPNPSAESAFNAEVAGGRVAPTVTPSIASRASGFIGKATPFLEKAGALAIPATILPHTVNVDDHINQYNADEAAGKHSLSNTLKTPDYLNPLSPIGNVASLAMDAGKKTWNGSDIASTPLGQKIGDIAGSLDSGIGSAVNAPKIGIERLISGGRQAIGDVIENSSVSPFANAPALNTQIKPAIAESTAQPATKATVNPVGAVQANTQKPAIVAQPTQPIQAADPTATDNKQSSVSGNQQPVGIPIGTKIDGVASKTTMPNGTTLYSDTPALVSAPSKSVASVAQPRQQQPVEQPLTSVGGQPVNNMGVPLSNSVAQPIGDYRYGAGGMNASVANTTSKVGGSTPQERAAIQQQELSRPLVQQVDPNVALRNSLVTQSLQQGNIGDRARRESALANIRMMDDNTQNAQANAMKQQEFAYGVGKDAKASKEASATAQQAQKNWEAENQDKNLVYTPATYKLNPDTQQMELTDAQTYNKKTGEYKVIKQDKPQDLDMMIKNAQHYSQNGTPEQKKASLEFLAENGVK